MVHERSMQKRICGIVVRVRRQTISTADGPRGIISKLSMVANLWLCVFDCHFNWIRSCPLQLSLSTPPSRYIFQVALIIVQESQPVNILEFKQHRTYLQIVAVQIQFLQAPQFGEHGIAKTFQHIVRQIELLQFAETFENVTAQQRQQILI